MKSNSILAAAKRLFDWNAAHLVQAARFNASDLGQFFAESFQVKANGRTYDANLENYFEFLNQFRATIRSIRYELGESVVDLHQVAIPLKAHIIRTHEKSEDYEAILILKFNENHKIVLWHEVYVLVIE